MKWSKIKLVVCLAIACMACACVSNSDRIENALMEGNLKDAEMYLKKINDRGVRRYYGGLLIDEYLAVDNLDKAIFVFDKITGHCSMYQMQYTSLYDSDSYTQTYSKKLYDALLITLYCRCCRGLPRVRSRHTARPRICPPGYALGTGTHRQLLVTLRNVDHHRRYRPYGCGSWYDNLLDWYRYDRYVGALLDCHSAR